VSSGGSHPSEERAGDKPALSRPRIIVRLSGADVLGKPEGLPPGAILEVRQYHRDFQGEDREQGRDDFGIYETEGWDG
jgi:hypothetical protein